MTTSTKPYLIRALYEWCADNGLTPYLVAWVNQHTRVPQQFVKDDEIVFNIGMNATKDLQIDNEWVHFHARFGGVAQEIWIPIGHVISLFAKETGEGMSFEVQAWQPETADDAPNAPKTDESVKKKVLKLVK